MLTLNNDLSLPDVKEMAAIFLQPLSILTMMVCFKLNLHAEMY